MVKSKSFIEANKEHTASADKSSSKATKLCPLVHLIPTRVKRSRRWSLVALQLFPPVNAVRSFFASIKDLNKSFCVRLHSTSFWITAGELLNCLTPTAWYVHSDMARLLCTRRDIGPRAALTPLFPCLSQFTNARKS